MAKVNYREGDLFAVPLRDGGFATGVVARANPKAALLGYFFGPRREAIPTLADVASLKPNEAVLVGRFGHLGLTQSTWPIIGRLTNWDRAEWPTPVFTRFEELSGRTFTAIYDDDDPAKLLREELASGPAATGPNDGLMGAGYVERSLSALLGGTAATRPRGN
jgi:Immunity protein 26